MVGCRYIQEQLDKNYLYLAERLGVTVIPETKVTRIQPKESEIHAACRAFHVAFFTTAEPWSQSSGLKRWVLGTVPLLMNCRDKGDFAHLSPQLGNFVRTNNEAIVGVGFRGKTEE